MCKGVSHIKNHVLCVCDVHPPGVQPDISNLIDLTTCQGLADNHNSLLFKQEIKGGAAAHQVCPYTSYEYICVM